MRGSDAEQPRESEAGVLPGRMSGRARVLQGVGFVVGLALFVWAVSLAFSQGNREALEKLRTMPWGTITALVSLTACSLVLNGLMFFVTARPLWKVRPPLGEQQMPRVPVLDALAINCIATLLSLLPFKLGLLVRSMLHVRKHATPVPALLAWFAAFGAMTLTTALLAGGLALVRGRVDAWWAGALVVGVALLAMLGAIVVPWVLGAATMMAQVLSRGMPRALRHGAGGARLRALVAPLSIIASDRLAFVLHAGLRVLDFGTFAARFALLASALGVALSPEHALLLGSTFLLLNALAPAGSLGFAEMGVAGAGTLVGLPTEQIVLLSLLTTALQSVVAAGLGGVGWFGMGGSAKRTTRADPS